MKNELRQEQATLNSLVAFELSSSGRQNSTDLGAKVLKFKLYDEFQIDEHRAKDIRELLAASFPEENFSRTRTYFKQITARRLLVCKNDQLVGHLGLEHRVIGTSTGPATIFGVVDLCVALSFQGQGIASEMLRWVENLATVYAVDFLMLFAQDGRVYDKSGFQRENNSLRWTMIHEHQTIGIGEEPLDELMVKSVGNRLWPSGNIDLLGFQF